MPVYFTRRSKPIPPDSILQRFVGNKILQSFGSTTSLGGEDISDFDKIQQALGPAFNVLLPPRRTQEFLQFDFEIGRGGFGVVYRASPTSRGLQSVPTLKDGRHYAVKRVSHPCHTNSPQDVSVSMKKVPIERVAHFLSNMASAEVEENHVVRMFSFFLQLPFYIDCVLEYLAGPDLFDFLSTSPRPLSEQDSAMLMKQMITAVHYLHRVAGALHRDVKPENMCFVSPVRAGDPLPSLKLFDLGSAWVLEETITEESAGSLWELPRCGTLLYMAPETWSGSSGAPSDLWAVGVIAHLFLTLQLPLGMQKLGVNAKALRKAAEQGDLEFGDPRWAPVSAEAKAFVSTLLAKDAAARLTSTQALAHPWLHQEHCQTEHRPPTSTLPPFEARSAVESGWCISRSTLSAHMGSDGTNLSRGSLWVSVAAIQAGA